MTTQEAINYWKDILKVTEENNDDCIFDTTQDDIDALKMAIEALEKQVSKKVEYIDDLGRNACNCPSCKTLYWSEYPNYCSSCGQKLDWSGEDE